MSDLEWNTEANFPWSPQTLSVYTGAEVLARLDFDRALEALKGAFLGLADGTSVQPNQVAATLPDGMGDTIFYTGVVASQDVVGVTVSPYLERLEKAGHYPISSYTLLVSTQTGKPILLCESEELVGFRTGATTSLAVTSLIYDTDQTLAIIGAGPIARWHARFAVRLRSWDKVSCYSPTINSPESARRRQQWRGIYPEVCFSETLDAAVNDSDVVMLCTSSATPIVELSQLRPGALLTSITTNAPLAHEVAPTELGMMDVYCDYSATTPSVAGEMVLASRSGEWSSSEILADLPALLSGTILNRRSERVRYFRSVGLGIEDVAVAGVIAN